MYICDGETVTVRIIYPEEGGEGKHSGVMTEAQVGAAVTSVCQCGIGFLHEIPEQWLKCLPDSISVLDGVAPHSVNHVVAPLPKIGQFFRSEEFAEDFDAEEIQILAKTARRIY